MPVNGLSRSLVLTSDLIAGPSQDTVRLNPVGVARELVGSELRSVHLRLIRAR